jgi:hypothetical protein
MTPEDVSDELAGACADVLAVVMSRELLDAAV